MNAKSFLESACAPPPFSLSRRAEAALSLFAVCLASLCLPLGFTGVAVALHAIGIELSAGPEALMWVNNAFMLGFGSLLLAFGSLADRQGRRRWFLLGVGLYAMTSAAVFFAPDIATLNLLRAAQGVAAAAVLGAGPAVLAQVFEGPSRMRAYSALGASFGIGLAFGPLLAGLLVHGAGWRVLFLVLAASAAMAGLIASCCLRESRDPGAAGRRLDVGGAASFSLALALLTWAVLRAPDRGWDDLFVGGLLAGAAVLLGVFVRVELRTPHPMLDLRLFRRVRFVGVQWLAMAPAWSFVVLLVVLPLRFIGMEGRSEVQAGWWMLALSGPMLVVPLLAGWLTRWCSPAMLSGTGLLGCALGLAWLAQRAPGAGAWTLLGPLLLIGGGIGLPWGLMDGLAVSVVPSEQAGMAAGIFNTLRVAGEGIAIALVGSLLAGSIAAHLAHLPSAASAGSALLAQAAHLAAAGDAAGMRAALPDVPAAQLQAAYEQAFRQLLYVLATISLGSALVAVLALGRSAADARALSRAAKTETA